LSTTIRLYFHPLLLLITLIFVSILFKSPSTLHTFNKIHISFSYISISSFSDLQAELVWAVQGPRKISRLNAISMFSIQLISFYRLKGLLLLDPQHAHPHPQHAHFSSPVQGGSFISFSKLCALIIITITPFIIAIIPSYCYRKTNHHCHLRLFLCHFCHPGLHCRSLPPLSI
jgi:hypothetical protein